MSLRRFVVVVVVAITAVMPGYAQDLDDAVVYTVRVPLGTTMSDTQLKALALTPGTT